MRARSLLLLSIFLTGFAMAQVPFARYEPTPQELVSRMLELAAVRSDDLVYDLGCGDGRIVIMAAQEFGARGVGIDIDERLVRRAQYNARKSGVSERVRFVHQNLFEADIRGATVVTLFLLPKVNLMLRPKLLRELAPGTRIVSHDHDMGDWKPDRTLEVTDNGGKRHRLHLWTVPPHQSIRPAAPRVLSVREGRGYTYISIGRLGHEAFHVAGFPRAVRVRGRLLPL